MLRSFFLKTLNKYASRWLVLFIDLVLVCFSFLLAYAIRFNISFDFNTNAFFIQLPIIVVVALLSFLIVGSYKGIVRHTGTNDIFNVFSGVTLFSFSLGALVAFNQVIKIIDVTIPISVIIIHYLVTIFILITSRYIFKAIYEVIVTEVNTIKYVMIYGAGEAGIITSNTLNRDRQSNYDIIGFIDDDPNKIDKKIDRIKIYGFDTMNKKFVTKHQLSEVIIATQNIPPSRLIEITDKFLALDVDVKIVPPLIKWIDGDLSTNQIKQINIDDLLGRAKININNPIVQRDVDGQTILVTGAAGSIGSEIARQLITYNVKLLILLDQAESPLYDLQQEFLSKAKQNFIAVVTDVRDKKGLANIFKKYRPQMVFHAAAYKHVPLMEENPYEAIKVNVLGTKKVADLALEFEADRFVMVSTDKAVNPTNVMGASKRMAEMYISHLSDQSPITKFTTTRFGNVLGSNGSVIPLFKKQLENGGPLTVTHKEITRYFMTIPEACRLVLEAGTMGKGGEIYIFDMGKSVKIFDMAKRMISLSGLRYPDDIDIKITGLRPGEKLFEELLADGENTKKTYHEKILIAKNQELSYDKLLHGLSILRDKQHRLSNNEIVSIVKDIVPEYISNNSEFEKLDKSN